MVTIKEVVETLRECVDPELGASIIDLGLVYGVEVKGGKDVRVKMTMTSPMCPLTGMIMADAKLRLEAVDGIGKVDFELVWEPAWNPDMMSEELKLSR
jgi:metal-sulfur cluster biosynthetic enzyme